MSATLIRLSPEEANTIAPGCLTIGENKLPFPRRVRIKYLENRLGVSAHTIAEYRIIAFEEIQEYRESCLKRNPGYWAALAKQEADKAKGIIKRKRVWFDTPPLTAKEAEYIEVIYELFQEWKDGLIVRDHLNKRYSRPYED